MSDGLEEDEQSWLPGVDYPERVHRREHELDVTLRRLLILNDYGVTVEHHSDGPKSSESGAPFLSDEWLRQWYSEGTLPAYVWDDLREVGEP